MTFPLTPTPISPSPTTSSLDWDDLPYEQLLETDYSRLTDDQIREHLKIVQEQASNPGKRRAKVNQDADRAAGRPRAKISVSMDDLL